MNTETQSYNTEVLPFKVEVIEDQDRRGRYIFELHDNTRIFIKDPEEIPSINLDGNSFVLTPEEKPLNTKDDEYDAWVRTTTSEIMEDSKNIIVNNSPLGAIDLALTLMKKNEVPQDNASKLIELRSKLTSNTIDNSVLDYYDQFLSAGFRDEDKNLRYSKDGLMLLAMSISGDDNANRELSNRVNQLNNFLESNNDFLEPGTKLTEDQLEKIEQAHLVAIHTTFTEAEEDEIFQLKSTSSHNKKAVRSTIHWSLNHAVISHIMGDFSNRDDTIVSKLETLARDNGSPAVMYGVDTYFTMNPNEELRISENIEDTVIISFKDSLDIDNSFKYQGNKLFINKDKLNGNGLGNILNEFTSEKYNAKHAMAILIARENTYSLGSDAEERDSNILKLLREKAQSHPKDANMAALELIESIVDGSINPIDYPSFIYEDKRFKTSFRNPSLNEELQELVRRTIIDSLITRMGGKIVFSDGMSAYIQNEGFDNQVVDVAHELGIRVGLHSHQSEYFLESYRTYGDALRSNKKAMRHLARFGVEVEKAPRKLSDEDMLLA